MIGFGLRDGLSGDLGSALEIVERMLSRQIGVVRIGDDPLIAMSISGLCRAEFAAVAGIDDERSHGVRPEIEAERAGNLTITHGGIAIRMVRIDKGLSRLRRACGGDGAYAFR